jgi:hypothetical protein
VADWLDRHEETTAAASMATPARVAVLIERITRLRTDGVKYVFTA